MEDKAEKGRGKQAAYPDVLDAGKKMNELFLTQLAGVLPKMAIFLIRRTHQQEAGEQTSVCRAL